MPLASGDRLGPYEIVAALGSGGMGEVYRARDPKLGREVAIKVLPAAVAQDPERLARFKREAQVLAALNHPNIAAIYGLEDAGDTPFLVMELVEGEDLAERLKRGRIPLDDALRIARQIAEALEEAHGKGIVHRDLKPANVKRTPDGKVKVLDFGLAKAIVGEVSGTGSTSTPSILPTVTSAGTAVGMILGTAAYMSPEQARGKTVDKRTDVWAFGCLLFEMIAGDRPFEGEDITETLAAIVRGEPDWGRLPTDLPPAVRVLLERCLVKDRDERLSDMSVVRFLMGDAAKTLSGARAANTAAPVARRRRVDGSGDEERLTSKPDVVQTPTSVSSDGRWLVFSEGGPGQPGGTGVWVMPLDGDRTPRPFFREPAGESDGQISPDGRWMAYQAPIASRQEIYVAPFPGPGPRQQVSTDGGTEPLWSRDGRELFFQSGTRLMAVTVAPGASFSASAPRLVHEGRYFKTINGNTSWSVTADGGRFLRIQRVEPERAVTRIELVLNWFLRLKP